LDQDFLIQEFMQEVVEEEDRVDQFTHLDQEELEEPVEEELELLALRQEQLELLTQVVVVDLLDFLVVHFQEEMVELVDQV
jgi:hypothetical protein